MPIKASFAHVNLIARDWRALSAFYIDILGCAPVPPERDLRGEELEAGTGVPGASLRGMHLRLPGGGDQGPTLEIFQYSQLAEGLAAAVNRPGYAHIAFKVEDVAAASEAVIAAGGRPVGRIVATRVGDGSTITWAYVADPEGNIIELQQVKTGRRPKPISDEDRLNISITELRDGNHASRRGASCPSACSDS